MITLVALLIGIGCGRLVDFATIRLAALFTPVALEPVASYKLGRNSIFTKTTQLTHF